VLVESTIEAGALVARHSHPGIESTYILEGGLDLPIEGQPTRFVKAGDFVQMPPGHATRGRRPGETQEPGFFPHLSSRRESRSLHPRETRRRNPAPWRGVSGRVSPRFGLNRASGQFLRGRCPFPKRTHPLISRTARRASGRRAERICRFCRPQPTTRARGRFRLCQRITLRCGPAPAGGAGRRPKWRSRPGERRPPRPSRQRRGTGTASSPRCS